VAVFLDFDGTLVEIAPTHDAIQVPDGLGARLAALSDRLDGRFALITGRSLADLAGHLGGLEFARAGSHGIECFTAGHATLGAAPRAIDRRAVVALAHFVAAHPGATLERKAFGAALHYRADPALEDVALVLARSLAQEHGLAVKRGKCVVELVPPGANKGSAVAAFMREAPFADALPIFLGDDVTDEDGFRAVDERGGFGIIIGDRHETCARYRLPNVRKVHEWLEL